MTLVLRSATRVARAPVPRPATAAAVAWVSHDRTSGRGPSAQVRLFVATKHGLATVLHSGDPAFSGLREHFEKQVGPALQMLLDNAERAGFIGAAPRRSTCSAPSPTSASHRQGARTRPVPTGWSSSSSTACGTGPPARPLAWHSRHRPLAAQTR